MRAGLIGRDGSFSWTDHPDPDGAAGYQVIDVAMAGIGPSDLMRARGLFGPIPAPYIAGAEGVGRLESGQRVYFGHSKPPFGSVAERTLVAADEIWDIPDELADDQIVALGVSGTGALIALEEARIAAGETVLVLGATGPVGQIAVQVARRLGAGRVVAAARSRSRLDEMLGAGIADAVAVLGEGEDEAVLKAASDGGYDVVLDVIYGPPAEAAMRATRPGARMMSIGVQAGATVTLTLRDLVFRSHIGVGTGQRSVTERRAAFDRLIAMALAGGLKVETRRFDFDQAPEAWSAQTGSPHGKIVIAR